MTIDIGSIIISYLNLKCDLCDSDDIVETILRSIEITIIIPSKLIEYGKSLGIHTELVSDENL